MAVALGKEQTQSLIPRDSLEEKSINNKSPPNKSRYGRAQKPKVNSDFVTYEDIEEIKPKLKKVTPTKSPLKNIQKVREIRFSTGSPKFINFTASAGKKPDDGTNKQTRKFFKSPMQGSKLEFMTKLYINQTTPFINKPTRVQTEILMPKEDAALLVEPEVVKIIAKHTPEKVQGNSIQKTPIKTYSKKRKSTSELFIESFGLPDDPLAPFSKEMPDLDSTPPKSVVRKICRQTPVESEQKLLTDCTKSQENSELMDKVATDHDREILLPFEFVNCMNAQQNAQTIAQKELPIGDMLIPNETINKLLKNGMKSQQNADILGEIEEEEHPIEPVSETIYKSWKNCMKPQFKQEIVNKTVVLDDTVTELAIPHEIIRKSPRNIMKPLQKSEIIPKWDTQEEISIELIPEMIRKSPRNVMKSQQKSGIIPGTAAEIAIENICEKTAASEMICKLPRKSRKSQQKCEINQERVVQEEDFVEHETGKSTSKEVIERSPINFAKSQKKSDVIEKGTAQEEEPIRKSVKKFTKPQKKIETNDKKEVLFENIARKSMPNETIRKSPRNIKTQQKQEIIDNETPTEAIPMDIIDDTIPQTKIGICAKPQQKLFEKVAALKEAPIQNNDVNLIAAETICKSQQKHEIIDEVATKEEVTYKINIEKSEGIEKSPKKLMKLQQKSIITQHPILKTINDKVVEKKLSIKNIDVSNRKSLRNGTKSLKNSKVHDVPVSPIINSDVKLTPERKSHNNLESITNVVNAKEESPIDLKSVKGAPKNKASDIAKKNQIQIKLLSQKENGLLYNISKTLNGILKRDADVVKEPTAEAEKPQMQEPIMQPEPETYSALEHQQFKEGDLAWARLGHHPFWPCLITKDPISNSLTRISSFKATTHTEYHLKFFGDTGRRSWVKAHCLIAFHDRNDLKKLEDYLKLQPKKNPKVIQACTVKLKHHLIHWDRGVEEAESLINKTIKERLTFFEKLLKSKTKTLKTGRLHSLSLSAKSNFDGDSSEDAAGLENAPIKRRSARKSLPVIKNDVSELGKKLRRQNSKSAESGSNSSLSHLSLVDVKRQNSHLLDNCSSEHSFSDTDSVSKLGVSLTLESQEDLYRRNNVFKGVSREKVCQLCEKNGKVLKCKGRCGGLYHAECVLNLELHQAEPEKSVLESCEINKELEFVKGEPLKVEVVDVKVKHKNVVAQVEITTDPSFQQLNLFEKIDVKMQEIMTKFEAKTTYADSTTDYTSSEDSASTTPAKIAKISHVTGDDVVFDNKAKEVLNDAEEFKCSNCLKDVDPPCCVCLETVSKKQSSVRQKCSLYQCGKFYHHECLKLWPQTQWSLISTTRHKETDQNLDMFVCPSHVCHTCVSDDPRAQITRCSSDKVARCLKCPATYHTSNYCLPAGTMILSSSQIICPRHLGCSKPRKYSNVRTINTTWCFICSKGGDLICCETCPTSVHNECMTINFTDDDTFICEDCESGRFPLYDEIVWVKLGSYRWWPAVTLFPKKVPEKINKHPHEEGEFVVKFFGTHNYYWVGRGRVFLFQEGDKGYSGTTKKKVDTNFQKAIEEAIAAHQLKKDFKSSKVAKMKNGLKPPPFIRIKVNKPVGNVRSFDGNVSNTTPCECDAHSSSPCGPDSDCLNRLLLTECDPQVCPAGVSCHNQQFEKRVYPPLVPYKTDHRGWGLKCMEPITKGQFVIEYVGEIIDDDEYQRRVKKMNEQKDDNYYFLTIDKDRMLDAGPKGNVSRFMNHSCQPNCETQKWTVNGDTRVGLFALQDIVENEELTFNYNLECIGKEKKACRCSASNCSGFIGVKVKQDEPPKRTKRYKKKKPTPVPQTPTINNDPCFICGRVGEVGACQNKICNKFYHLGCVQLEVWPEGRWVCPWHNCKICTKRTIRCCVKCVNSYCPTHAESKIRYDTLLGFICSEHDSLQRKIESKNVTLKKTSAVTRESDVTSTTEDEVVAENKSGKSYAVEDREAGSIEKHVETILNEPSQDTVTLKRKRGRKKKDVGNAPKKIKLDETIMSSSTPSQNLRSFSSLVEKTKTT